MYRGYSCLEYLCRGSIYQKSSYNGLAKGIRPVCYKQTKGYGNASNVENGVLLSLIWDSYNISLFKNLSEIQTLLNDPVTSAMRQDPYSAPETEV
jgi:hypothetical protein